MVEEKKRPVHTASDLSYLKQEEQAAVADAIKKEDKVNHPKLCGQQPLLRRKYCVLSGVAERERRHSRF